MRFIKEPRKCPACRSDLEYLKHNRKYHCKTCSKPGSGVIWSTEYLNGVEDAASGKYPKLMEDTK